VRFFLPLSCLLHEKYHVVVLLTEKNDVDIGTWAEAEEVEHFQRMDGVLVVGQGLICGHWKDHVQRAATLHVFASNHQLENDLIFVGACVVQFGHYDKFLHFVYDISYHYTNDEYQFGW
tara:strand:- start:5 stop:361 length:357 start_codon:yes stop_codon:yes gene_type:complete